MSWGPAWNLPRPYTLIEAVFGDRNPMEMNNGCAGYAEEPPYYAYDEEGHTVWWAIRKALGQKSERGYGLTPREIKIVIERFGLSSGKGKTLEQVGAKFGVNRERIRQIEAKALRKLRHPMRGRHLRPFMRPYSNSVAQAAMARAELAGILKESMPRWMAMGLAIRMRRRHLAKALRAAQGSEMVEVGRAIAASCFYEVGKCPLDGEPTLPGFERCLIHLDTAKKVIHRCDGCGTIFARSWSQMQAYIRLHGRSQHKVFCTLPCFYEHGGRLAILGRKRAA